MPEFRSSLIPDLEDMCKLAAEKGTHALREGQECIHRAMSSQLDELFASATELLQGRANVMAKVLAVVVDGNDIPIEQAEQALGEQVGR